MVLKELLRRGCAVVVMIALVSYYSFTGVYVKAGEVVSGGAVELVEASVTDESTESVEMLESQNNIEESQDDSEEISQENEYAVEDELQQETDTIKQKKNYIVKFNSKNAMNSVKKKHKESEQINDNDENNLEERALVSMELSEKEADKLEQNEGVEYIEEDYIMEGCKNEKKLKVKKENRIKRNESTDEWNVRMIKAQNKIQKGKKHVKIAILDSGIDWGNDIDLVYQVSLVPGEEEMTQLFMDGNGHGSSVASLIAASDDGEGITGINPNVDIYSYRVLAEGNGAPVSRVVEAIYMAIEQKVNIINMSFGMDNYSEALETAIHDAAEAGILVIAAAGNTGEEGVQYPAAYKDVMAVGAVNKYGDVEDYSAKGDELEIVAPGELVRTTGFLGSEEVTSGTSLAAPQVAAVASLIWEKDLSVSADFVRGLLDESANLYGHTGEYGNGLVDAEYALLHYEEYKKNYKKNGKKTNVSNLDSENNSTIITFEDTGCVEGCWSRDNHENMINSNYPIVRYGARFPDNKSYVKSGQYNVYNFAGMYNNPWWHGWYDTNYIKAVIYATNMADAIKKYGKCKQSLAVNLGYKDADEMLYDISEMDISDIWVIELNNMKRYYNLNKIIQSQTDSKEYRRSFLWGMAIHSATDIYAHSVVYNGELLNHNEKKGAKADKKEVCENRYNDAQSIAKKMMTKYTSGQSLNVSDLVPSSAPNNYKLCYLYKYVSSVDKDFASNVSSYSYTPSTK